MNPRRILYLTLLSSLGLLICAAQTNGPHIGVFQGHSDIGTVLHVGSAEYDNASQTYTLSGSGDNMWFAQDDFQFAWKKMSDENVTLTADISLLGNGGDNHRKGVLMIRQSLEEDSAYADVARHGDGLTSLQFRDEKGAITQEIESSMSAPQQLRIAKRGDRFYMWVGAGPGKELRFAGGSTRVPLTAPFYVGIGVCAHNKDAIQKVAFSNVGITTTQNRPNVSGELYSTLETINVTSTDARVSYVAQQHIEYPSWSPDGANLLFHSGTNIQTVPLAGRTPEAVQHPNSSDNATDSQPRLSPDGKQSAFLTSGDVAGEVLLSVKSVPDGKTRVLAHLQGGPGSLGAHPWSPDGQRLVFISYQSIQ